MPRPERQLDPPVSAVGQPGGDAERSRPIRPAAAFFAKVVLIYTLLMIPWPGVAEAYGYLFRAAGNTFLRNFGSAGLVYFKPAEKPPQNRNALDFTIRLENTRTRIGGWFDLERNTRKMGFLPTAFATSLILATPIPWRRRLWAVAWGVLLISVFVGLQVALHLVNAFSDPNPLRQFDLAPWVKGMIGIGLKIFVITPVTAYVVPIFVWVMVTFRRGDAAALLGAHGWGEGGLAAHSSRIARAAR